MKTTAWLTSALAALVMAACGTSESSDATPGTTTSAKASPSGEATAEQVAKEMRGKVKCPAKVSVKRAANEPVDDVVGVRPLMPWKEAANLILCDREMLVITENSGRGYNIDTYGQTLHQGFDAKFAEPRKVKTSRDYMIEMSEEMTRRSGNAVDIPLEPGQVRWFASTMGLPGQEQVLSIAREEYYATDQLPPVESVLQALVEKYGQPSLVVDDNQIVMLLYWLYDPAGNKMPPTDPRVNRCRVSVSPDAGTSLSEDCGIAVGAGIRAAQNNRELAHSLAVNAQQGAAGYALLKSTEAALQQTDETRKAEELNKARKGAAKPKL